ncbi:PAS domain S-box protein, partial [Vibrio parahaemolyticus]|uniref:PAS domain-containing protein n=1 Tax=Vibrio parahaemolyticus TaxID=670 RepID=UPI001A8D6883|nr:PAS domain S-box protein [Vibrio parahaemolyticus]
AKDALGKILYYEGSILDISERRRAEQALRQREARFRALVQHSQDITEIVDREGRVLYVSPNAQFQGYDPEYWMYHPVNILDYLHPEDQEQG